MELINYVRRCKTRRGVERYEKMHIADNVTTACGKELNEMWFVESSAGLTFEDVTCKQCREYIKHTQHLILQR